MNTKFYDNKKRANSILVYIKNGSIKNGLKRKEALQVVNEYYELPKGNEVNNNSWRNSGDKRYIKSAIPFEELEDDIKELTPYLKGEKEIQNTNEQKNNEVKIDNVVNSDDKTPTDNIFSLQGYEEVLQILHSISDKQDNQFDQLKSFLNNINTNTDYINSESEVLKEKEKLQNDYNELKVKYEELLNSEEDNIDLSNYVSKEKYDNDIYQLQNDYNVLNSEYEDLKNNSNTISQADYDKLQSKYNKAVDKVKNKIEPEFKRLQEENEKLKNHIQDMKDKVKSDYIKRSEIDELGKETEENIEKSIYVKDEKDVNKSDYEVIDDFLNDMLTDEENFNYDDEEINKDNKEEVIKDDEEEIIENNLDNNEEVNDEVWGNMSDIINNDDSDEYEDNTYYRQSEEEAEAEYNEFFGW